ncbi:hypothetical protein ACOSQ3_022219 [Xanthoceras sorbifolium]
MKNVSILSPVVVFLFVLCWSSSTVKVEADEGCGYGPYYMPNCTPEECTGYCRKRFYTYFTGICGTNHDLCCCQGRGAAETKRNKLSVPKIGRDSAESKRNKLSTYYMPNCIPEECQKLCGDSLMSRRRYGSQCADSETCACLEQ